MLLSGAGDPSAGGRLRRIGLAGATAGALLAAYSGLPSATAAEHLLHERHVQASGDARPGGLVGVGTRHSLVADDAGRQAERRHGGGEQDAAAGQAVALPAPPQIGGTTTAQQQPPAPPARDDSPQAVEIRPALHAPSLPRDGAAQPSQIVIDAPPPANAPALASALAGPAKAEHAAAVRAIGAAAAPAANRSRDDDEAVALILILAQAVMQ